MVYKHDQQELHIGRNRVANILSSMYNHGVGLYVPGVGVSLRRKTPTPTPTPHPYDT